MLIKQLQNIGLVLSLALVVNVATAEEQKKDDRITPADIPTIDPDVGRIGEVRRVPDFNEFRVCADPDNMPFSNVRQEGFEDKIAQVLADDLGKPLKFTYAYNRQGFLRNTINANRCDIVMGVTSDFDPLRTSKPYYRSGHVWVWRKDSNFNIKEWDSPDLKKGIIGIIDHAPSTIPLNDHGLLANSRPYRMQRDLNLPPSYMIDDLGKGDIDVAIVWGPIGGYFAKESKIPMQVQLIPEYEKENAKGKEYWNISIGVRKREKDRMEQINAALARNQDKIMKILDDYGIPHVPVVEGDSLEKVYKEDLKKK